MAVVRDIPNHLIQTKLYPPRVPDRLISRRQLLERLSSGQIPPVTLISAPAGYGKSTLAHQWLESCKVPYAWLSLDDYDSELLNFLEYLIAALGIVVTDLGTEVESMLRQTQLPKAERLADGLVHDLQQALPGPLCLAIDDYHTISNRNIHFFMERLLQRLPANLHLIMISRVDPPLALARMRAGGQLREIRAAQLRFTVEEAALLLEQVVGRPVSGETVELLAEHMEGWPVGLRMAAMSLRDSPDARPSVGRFRSMGQKLVTDYLLNEVLIQLPKEQQALFLVTAVPDRFSASLVDALAGEDSQGGGGQDFIDLLWSSNFFLIAMDDQGTWFRYHQLFRQLLQQRLAGELSPQEVAVLHQKAGAWFEEADMVEHAIVHYVRGGVGDKAARLIERHAHEALNKEEWRRLERWVNLLPVEYQSRPGLLAVQAAILQLQMRYSSFKPLLDAAEKGLDSGVFDYPLQEARSWRGMVELFRGILFTAASTPQYTLQQAEKGLASIDPSADYVRGVAENWMIIALHQSGKTGEAIEKARKELESSSGLLDARTHRLLVALVNIYYNEADVSNLRSLGISFRDIALQADHQMSLGWANFALGWSAYQQNDLQEALAYFSALTTTRYSAHVRCAIDGIVGQALCQAALGRADEVAETLALLREFFVDQDRYMMLPLVDSLQARLERNWGSIATSVEVFSSAVEQLASDSWEKPALTACRAAIIYGDDISLLRIQRTLSECTQFARSRNQRRELMHLGALEALLLERHGTHMRALSALRSAVTLGEPSGALRIFVDLGPQLIPLLRELGDQGVAVSYIEQILAAFDDEVEVDDASPEPQEISLGLSPAAEAIKAELTNREMEVLIFLGQRLTNKEISAKLYLSPHTVKKYTLDIYRKLDVEGRRQAVAHARELGIL